MTNLDAATAEPCPHTKQGPHAETSPPRRPRPPLLDGRTAGAQAIDWDTLAPSGWYGRRGKRLLDLALLAVVVPLALVPFAAVALANLVAYRRPRAIFFTQRRVGLRGAEFVIWKFRTMTDADRDSMDSWTRGTDPARVTPLGRILRNTHLDELPQLINVLRGDMQLIGPRPEMVEVERWACAKVPGFETRLAIRPGVTGLAQVTQGYAACDPRAYARKLRLNRLYLERLSLRLDLAIVLRTALWVLRGKGSRWDMPRRRAPDAADEVRAASRSGKASATGRHRPRGYSISPGPTSGTGAS